ncbi:MAG: hypothetical protein WKG52_10010 [Variovorax sp.]
MRTGVGQDNGGHLDDVAHVDHADAGISIGGGVAARLDLAGVEVDPVLPMKT